MKTNGPGSVDYILMLKTAMQMFIIIHRLINFMQRRYIHYSEDIARRTHQMSLLCKNLHNFLRATPSLFISVNVVETPHLKKQTLCSVE